MPSSPPASSRPSRTTIALVLTFFTFVLYLSRPTPRRVARTSASVCSFDELTAGSWVARTPAVKQLEELLHGTQTNTGLECEGEGRSVQSANLVFKPLDEERCPSWRWNDEVVVRHLLSMPEGMIIVGDSLAEQTLAAFRTRLALDVLVSFKTILMGDLTGTHKTRLHQTLTLVPSHPLYTQFLESNEFSAERLARPLVQHFRADQLLSDPELALIIPPSDPEGPSVERIGYAYGSDLDWRKFVHQTLAQYDEPPPQGTRGTQENTRKTVVMVSTGPHWHERHFTNVELSDLATTMIVAYEAMVHRIFSTIPDDPHLHFIVHSQHSVPLNCASISSPDLTSTLVPTTFFVPPPPVRFNHALFPQFNEMFRRGVEEYVGKKGRLTVAEVFDDVAMMGKRQEAMRAPVKMDCLHFCLPARHETLRILMQHIM